MLYKPEHVPLIKEGKKTQTRRFWWNHKKNILAEKPRMKVGNIYKCKTQMVSKDFFGAMRVLRVWKEAVGDISFVDAVREGYSGQNVYLRALFAISQKMKCEDYTKLDDSIWSIDQRKDFLNRKIWCVEFEFIDKDHWAEIQLKELAPLMKQQEICPHCGPSYVTYTIFKGQVTKLILCCQKESEV